MATPRPSKCRHVGLEMSSSSDHNVLRPPSGGRHLVEAAGLMPQVLERDRHLPRAVVRAWVGDVMTTQVQPALRRRGSEERSLRTRKLFESIQFCDSEEERRASLDTVIELHLDLAHAEAARYRNRG